MAQMETLSIEVMSEILPAIGATLHSDRRCTFSVWAPLKNNVELVLPEHGGKTVSMTQEINGYWGTVLEDVTPLTRYFFRIDKNELPDPASRYQPDGVHGPSAVVDQGFSWSDENWKGLPLKEMIIYELHVGTFTPEGTFDGVIGRLSYLTELGINAIELMPLAQFPGDRNWGYDGVYPFAVQNSYGGAAGLKKLVNEAHLHGIAVILDVVYNHQGPEGNYFGEFAPYFSDKYKTFWGSAINFDDAYCDGVRNFYWQNALMWLDEFHIDGLRMDAVHAIWDFSAEHFVEVLTKKVKDLQKRSGCEKILIAEFDLNNPRYINAIADGGYGMDGQWIDEFHHALHSLITGEKDGYYEDFGTAAHLAKSMKDSYVYTGEYSAHRKKFFGRLPEKNPYSQFVVFAQNHDQVGNRMLGDRLTRSLSFEGLKLAAATVLLAPQVPLLFMGEEYGERNPFQYFISHTDEKLVEMVREGRRKEFSYFKWEGEVPDPQSRKTFEACILSWNYDHEPEQKKLLHYYRELISFRKNRKAMKGHLKADVRVFDPHDSPVIAFERSFDNDRILVVLNFDRGTCGWKVPSSIKGVKIFDSASLAWRGPGEIVPDMIDTGNEILMHPHSAAIFEL
jgi:maltooligosyltrehalose trehalohydrolase